MRADLDDQIPAAEPPGIDLVMLDEALNELSKWTRARGRSWSFDTSAGCRNRKLPTHSVSRATVTREWKRARAWLYHRMTLRRQAASVPLSLRSSQLAVDLQLGLDGGLGLEAHPLGGGDALVKDADRVGVHGGRLVQHLRRRGRSS